MKSWQIITLLLLLNAIGQTLTAQDVVLSGTIFEELSGDPVPAVEIHVQEINKTIQTDRRGNFHLPNLEQGAYTLIIFATNFKPVTQTIQLGKEKNVHLPISLETLTYDLSMVQVEARAEDPYQQMGRLRNVEGTAIYAAKKSEVIQLENMVANLATNNARQIYQGVAGLNIWENDGAGLQLSIGARGLDPNRTSNFNTRQNGYDISADALGYPESYYTPPAQALKRIEIVRGAASLQYGPQFGGLLNFVFKEGPKDKAFEFNSENTVGSWGLLNTFNSIGGSKEGWNYYGFFQRKQGNGWRPNSPFHQNTAYAHLSKKIGSRLTVTGQYTYMNYLAQQPGGLQDFEFAQDARQSKRTRNWFQVDWNLAALILDYRISDKARINSRTFHLSAGRQALGELGPINRPDPMRERDLIRGMYNNWGNETRLIYRYGAADHPSTLLVGLRYYEGFSESRQGFADDGSEANFTFLNPEDPERAAYEFPSRNVSFFVENLFNLSHRWHITPGIRFEHIRTAAEGFFKERVLSGNQLLLERTFPVERANPRSLVLLGIGSGYKVREHIEVYANFSQNYRSINFSDLAVINPNLVIDSLLSDERGWNADLGMRGEVRNFLTFDISAFYLSYQDRIGTGEIVLPDAVMGELAVPYRTNIGDARILGLEAYAELDLLRLANMNSQTFGVRGFINASVLDGMYVSGESQFRGRKVELIPPFSLKTGLSFNWRQLSVSYQFAHVAAHFSDATNAAFTNDATRGIIPAYSVQDLSVSYQWTRYKLQAGINNLTDARYFTRRAMAYPGPGIIPADGRSFYVTVGVQL